jgi:DNA-binding transcriptional MerR regulator
MRVTKHPDRPLSISEAAAAVGYSTTMLRVLERRGLVTPIRFGAHDVRVYLPEHLDQLRAYRMRRGRKK